MTRTLSKGYKFSRYSFFPKEKIEEFNESEKYTVSVKQGFGKPVPLNVNAGDSVYAGQIIGSDDNTVSNPIHSPVNGIVESIVNGEDGKPDRVIIKSTDSSEWKPLPSYDSNWNSIPAKTLEELIYRSGAGALDADGIPTRFNSSNILPENVKHVIINGVDSGVYNFSNAILFKENGVSGFKDGLGILQKIMPGAVFHAALNKKEKKINIKLLKQLSGNSGLKIYKLNSKYPQGKHEILISSILGIKYPYKTSSSGIGVIVLSMQTVMHVYEAVCLGKPVIERIVALCGSGFKENIYMKIKIGTSVEDILKKLRSSVNDLRLVLNNLLTGTVLKINNVYTDRTFFKIIAVPEERQRQFLAFIRPGFKKDSYSNTFLTLLKKECNTNMKGEQRPCLFCNYCDSVCPVNILPFLISKYVERNIIDENIINLKIFNCVDCNLCSYVCPSKIPVAENIKKGKEEILAQSELFPSLKDIDVNAEEIKKYEEIK